MIEGASRFSLKGRTALVTGATGYLGAQMAAAIAESGGTVLVNSRSVERCTDLVKSLCARGLLAECAAFDVTSQNEVEGFARRLAGRPLHILVNNAYGGGAGSVEVASTDAYSASYDLTVVSAHRLLRTFLPNLRSAASEPGGASVINVASMYAMVSPDQRIYDTASGVNPPFYGAAKAALLQWTRYAACEFGAQGIRVNAISPGPFPSQAVQRANPAFIARLEQKVPMGRVGAAEEIRGPILFLASSASSFVNGSNLVVDGGWTAW